MTQKTFFPFHALYINNADILLSHVKIQVINQKNKQALALVQKEDVERSRY